MATTTGPGREPCLWYDVSSLARHQGTASGIQRAASGLAIGLREARGARPIRFCVFDKESGFHALDEREVQLLHQRLERGLAAWEAPRFVRRLRRRLTRRRPLRAPFAPGDVLFNPGFATYKRRHQEQVESLLARDRLHYVGFVYDLVPVLFPEWWTEDQQARFRDWFCWTGRHASLLLCCSEATRRDAEAFYAAEGIDTRVETVPLGDDLPNGADTARRIAQSSERPRPFVLYVSTLEVRKNHRLLFQVWRRLLAAHGPDRIPDLVFVGRAGWLVDDFLIELRQARFLDGKIVWRERVDDAELSRLYASCLFTVYPSFYEGWGLPVAEALGFGKLCVASSSSSLPEVGRGFADHHDPHDVAEATARIERAIFDKAWRESREQRIRAEFRARAWHESATDVLDHVERLLTSAGGTALARHRSR